METPREPLSVEKPGEANPESLIVDGTRGLVAAGVVAVAAAGFLWVMLMAIFSGATVSNPSRDAGRFASAVAAGVVLALAGVIAGVARGRRETGGIGRAARRARRRQAELE